MNKRIFDVAGLGVTVVRARDAAGDLGFAEGYEPWQAAIVEHPHADISVIETECGRRLRKRTFLLGPPTPARTLPTPAQIVVSCQSSK